MRFVRLTLLACLFAAACASTTPAPAASVPAWTTMPPIILDAVCARIRNDAISSLADVAIVTKTQPLATGASLRSVAHLYRRDGELGAVAQAINASTPSIPVEVSGSASCMWRAIEKIDPVNDRDVVTVELSSPFVNPFTKGEAGLLARMSVGGRDAQWYWVPLAERKGRWAVGIVLPTDLHEQ